MNTIIGEKLGMTQIFDDENRAIPVTAVKAGPVVVTQIKRLETDGYSAVQIAFKEMSTEKANRPINGHFAKAGVVPHRHVIEVWVDDPDAYELGQTISVADVFEVGLGRQAHFTPSLPGIGSTARCFSDSHLARVKRSSSIRLAIIRQA